MYRNIEQALIILDTLVTHLKVGRAISRSRKTLSQDNLHLSLVLTTIYGFDFRLPKPNRISCKRSVLAGVPRSSSTSGTWSKIALAFPLIYWPGVGDWNLMTYESPARLDGMQQCWENGEEEKNNREGVAMECIEF
jgi:hypothetical protein